jgi:mono/diheme cytochrome c family protein
MNPWIRRGLLAAVSLIALGAATLALGRVLGERKLHRQVPVVLAPVAIPTDAAGIERGRYLFASRGCTDCHGANGAGKVFIDDGKGMSIRAPNITRGPGGVTQRYTDVDWLRTIRHGVKPNGEPAFVMPSEDYSRLTDADVGALVAYLKQLPPAEGEGLVMQMPPLMYGLYAAGVLKDAAEKIDHALPPAEPVPAGVTREHGAYVAGMCIGCHGAQMSGGKIPGTPPHWPPAANLTPGAGSAMPAYATADQFVAMLRSGHRPDGTPISSVMPFDSLREMNDTDARALFLHLKQLPPRPAGQR